MLVSDIVKTALCLVGRKDAADAIDSDDYEDDRELSHAVKAMLHCFNAAEDELARVYFPLTCEEKFTILLSGACPSGYSPLPAAKERLHITYVPNILRWRAARRP